MAAASKIETVVTVSDSNYNKVYQHQWRTNTHGLPIGVRDYLNATCKHKWGYHFISRNWPGETGTDGKWYLDHTLYLSFEDEVDMAQVVMSVSI